jgi:type IV pilus assembly protein PilW
MYAPELRRAAGTARAGRARRGLSLVEMAVGIVVALLVGLAASTAATVFGASQRQGVATGAAVSGSGTALAALRDDVAAAGLGFFGNSTFLCSKLNLSVGTATLLDGVDFTPVMIATDGNNNSVVEVIYGTEVASGTNVLLSGTATIASAPLRSLLPVSVGQAVLLAPAAPGDPCVVRSVTATTAATFDAPQVVEFANVSTARFNRAAFTTNATYPDRARMTLLGDLRWSRYRLVGTDLVLQRPLGGADVVLARDVMAFRAEYGLADAGTTALAAWQPASGAFAGLTAANLPRVRALRMGIVTRSSTPEKADSAGNCQASTAMPTLFDAAVTADVTAWRCYRYRTSVIVVPLRNLVMGVAS